MVGLGRRHGEHVLPQLRLLQPPRNRAFEDARAVGTKAPPGDDEHTAVAGIAGVADESC